MNPDFPLLLQPLTIGSVTIPNRMMLSPMCQYSAKDGHATDWHLAHLAKFAAGGFGIVFVEATAVLAVGRMTHGDMGAWSDDHVPGLRRLADAIRAQGAVPAIQLGHSGRKGSTRRPWDGNVPLTQADRGSVEPPWQAESVGTDGLPGAWLPSRALDTHGIETVQRAFVDAAVRAVKAGYDIIEVHAAHGYLLHSFLSPLLNDRSDAYGGSLESRMRMVVEVVRGVRAVIGSNALFVRCSSIDGIEGGWSVDDTVKLARELVRAGADVIDCSSGGIAPLAPKRPGYQIPFAAKVRAEAGCKTVAVGLIFNGTQAEEALRAGHADIIAIAREALSNPNWALHAARELRDPQGFGRWPRQYAGSLSRRAEALRLANIEHPEVS